MMLFKCICRNLMRPVLHCVRVSFANLPCSLITVTCSFLPVYSIAL